MTLNNRFIFCKEVFLKLLNLIGADRAYFGEKDFQQYLLIKQMAEAFFLKTKIVGLPTIREADGLAMSSRNKLLTDKDRVKASIISKLLSSELTPKDIRQKLESEGFLVDYIEEHFGRRFAAAHLGHVRLIDNVKI